MDGGMLPDPIGQGPVWRDSAARLGVSPGQLAVMAGLTGAVVAAATVAPVIVAALAVLLIQIGFLVCAAWRVVLVLASRRPMPIADAPLVWPRYSILVALHDEAAVVAQLVGRLSRIDYPADRLEAFLLLEAHDSETIAAAVAADRPAWMTVVVVPPGSPRTKPRALNHGLARARGDLVTIFDAEDEPHPGQLREAAARFAADCSGRLACLQAPLRIRRLEPVAGATPFLDRQFAVEYAALFDVTLPAMARLGLPFPLGGTSNHFRADALADVCGWDAYNVTEDADLGYRLWRRGWRQGVLSRPTWEAPPGGLEDWLPQRTRWLKGFMQTWGVHTRKPAGLGWRGCFSLVMTLGGALAAASLHALSLAWVIASVMVALAAGLAPVTPAFAVSVLILGATAAWLHCAIGARRAGLAYSSADMVTAPLYWSLLSLAFVHAVWRLLREPHAWDKTTHRPDAGGAVAADALGAGRHAA